MAKSFNPSFESLDRRELMSSITLSTPHSSLIFGSDPMANVQTGTTSANVQDAVGAGYAVDIYQTTYAPISLVTYSFPNSLNGDWGTGYGMSSGGYAYRTAAAQTETPGPPRPMPTLHEYFDNHAGTDVIQVDVQYASTTHLPDDKYQVFAQVFAPRATIVPTFPPKTGAGSYGIRWTDGNNNAIAPGYSPGDVFGLNAAGPTPFRFAGVHSNETPVTGNFFFTQFASLTNVGSKGYQFNGPFRTGLIPWDDKKSNGLGLDEWSGFSNSGAPIATFGYYTTVKGWDAPGLLKTVFDQPGVYGPMSDRIIPYEYTFDANFTTAICFQAWGNSIPIIISTVDWSIVAHYNNTKAMNVASASNAFGSPSSWVGSSQVNSGVPINSNPRLIPGYNYNVVDFMHVQPTVYPAQGALAEHVAVDDRGTVQVPVRVAGPVDDPPEPVRRRPQATPVPAHAEVYRPLKVIYG